MAVAEEAVAAVEVAVQFAGFKNVDLFSQGIYQLRVSAQGAHSGRAAAPFATMESPDGASKDVPGALRNRVFVLPAHIMDATGEFCTPSFRVRYCEEEVLLRSLVQLKVDLSFVPHLGPVVGPAAAGAGTGVCPEPIEPLVLTVKLMHARSTTTFTSVTEDTGEAVASVEEQSTRHFKEVASQTLVVTVPVPTASAFFPVTFHDWHFCYVPLLIHATPLTVKLLRTTKASRSATGEKRQKPALLSPQAKARALSPRGAVASRSVRSAATAEGTAFAHALAAARQTPSERRDARESDEDSSARRSTTISLPTDQLALANAALHKHAAGLLRSCLALSARIALLEERAAAPGGPDGVQPSLEALVGNVTTAPPSPAKLPPSQTPGTSSHATRSPMPTHLHLPQGLTFLHPMIASPQSGDATELAASNATSPYEPATRTLPATATNVSASATSASESQPLEGISLDQLQLSEEGTDRAAAPAERAASSKESAHHRSAPDKLELPAPARLPPPNKLLDVLPPAPSNADATPPMFLPSGVEETLLRRIALRRVRLSSTNGGEDSSTVAMGAVAGAIDTTRLEEEIDDLVSTLTLAPMEESGEPLDGRAWAVRAMEMLAAISEQLWPRWHCLLDMCLLHPDLAMAELASSYVSCAGMRFGESVFRETRLLEQRAYVRHGERGISTTAMADSLRASGYYNALPPPAVRDGKWRPTQQPVFFEQRYASHAAAPPLPHAFPQLGLSWTPRLQRLPLGSADPRAAPSASPATHGMHLIVFVHGFHGNSYDLRTMRDQLALVLPHKEKMRFLNSAVNEEHTATASFESLGGNLAQEVLDFMQMENLTQTCTRLSFVCHSFGSIIARVALARPDMEGLRPLLHTYLSFSGPHLGMLYGSNALVELGMWGLRKWKKAQCLTELSLKDAKDAASTLLYRLSKIPVLSYFSNVLLVSSVEDRYVPHHSARIQLCDEAIHDARNGSIFASMVHNILGPLTDCNLLHVEVHFGEPPEDKLLAKLDAAIGRTAHISFLDNDAFVQMFVHTYLSFFV